MTKVKMRRSTLLEQVRQNRKRHRKVFEEAQVGYRAAVIKELDVMLSEARSGRRIRRVVSLAEPVDQTREYDRVIRMLEMTEEEQFELTELEFSQYVMDDWSWKSAFLTSNMRYSDTAAAEVAASGEPEYTSGLNA